MDHKRLIVSEAAIVDISIILVKSIGLLANVQSKNKLDQYKISVRDSG